MFRITPALTANGQSLLGGGPIDRSRGRRRAPGARDARPGRLTGARLGQVTGLMLTLAGAAGPGASLAAEHSARPPLFDRVHFTVEASTTVENDTLVASLFVQRERPDAARAAREINEIVGWALPLAKASPAVKVETLGYRTSPVYRQNRVEAWRVRQGLELRSEDSTAMTVLLGELQAKLALESVRYELSDAELARHEEALVGQALQAFRDRASAIAGHLDRPGYRIVRVDVGTHQARPPRPVPRHATAMMAESSARSAPPVIAGGSQTLRVTVSGEIELTASP